MSITTRRKVKNFTRSFAPWPSNGFGSSSGAGKIARLTTRPNTWTTSRKEVPFSPLSTGNKNHKTYGRQGSEDYLIALLRSYLHPFLKNEMQPFPHSSQCFMLHFFVIMI